MANTTNFGWETPDDTDLVKDGAAAMRTLGNAIDASFVDLKGGTTGQVLSKTSNTDLDFTWVTSDDANAIQNAIVDAKGDLIAASAADTPARLAVGADYTILGALSTESTGLQWQGGSTSFTPTLTNITIGNGTNTATYVRLGNVVHLTGKITFGSTTTIAAGAKISLPVNAKLVKQIAATVRYTDTGTNDYVGYFVIDSASTARFYTFEASSTYVAFQGISNTIPFTWTNTDEITYQLTYEVA